MKPRQQVSKAAIELIKRFEGYRRTAAQLDDGRWTIGFGHTKTARRGAEVSEADAEALLIYDLMEIAGALNDWVYSPLTQNQFNALAAFVFNIGLDSFKHSGVLRRLNEGALLQAACAMEMWRKADFEGERIVVDALVRRRAAEKVLFLTPTLGFMPAPSQILKPKVDHDCHGVVPAEAPVEVNTSMQGDRAVAERSSQVGTSTVAPVAPEPPPTIGPIELVEPEEEQSASQVAAAAITARLQSILNEPDDAPAAPVAVSAELDMPPLPESPEPVEAEPEPSEGFRLTPQPAEPFVPAEPVAEPAEAEAPGGEPELFTGEPLSFDEFDTRRVAHHDFDAISELDQTAVEPIRAVGVVPGLLGLGALGLVVFAAGLFWGFSAKHGVDGGMFSGIGLIGLILALIGIGCVATAVYFLLERLGGREEQ